MDKTFCNKTVKQRLSPNSLLILVLGLFIACNKPQEIKILFVGDILLSRNVRAEYEMKHSFPWDSLQEKFKTYNLVIGNLEGAVGSVADSIPNGNPSPVFDIDSADIHFLIKAGFSAVSIENNHSCDLGIAGKLRTIEVLTKHNIVPLHFDNSPHFFKVGETTLAVITLNTVLSLDSSHSNLPSIEIKQKLRLAKRLANIVIVYIHWGSELLDWPRAKQRTEASWLIKQGADVIIGSHPHVIQQPELIDGKPVFFSLGNQLFDQKYPATKKGLMAELCIKKGKLTVNGIITQTRHNSYFPVVEKSVRYNFKSISLKEKPFCIGKFEIKPVSVVTNNKPKLLLEAYVEGKRVWKTRPMSVISINKGKLDGKNDFIFTLEKHYSDMDFDTSLRPYVYSVFDKGINACWRGSALSWPLLDADLLSEDNSILVALHRGDSYIKLDKNANHQRIAFYRWNGFGFSGIKDSSIIKSHYDFFEY